MSQTSPGVLYNVDLSLGDQHCNERFDQHCAKGRGGGAVFLGIMKLMKVV